MNSIFGDISNPIPINDKRLCYSRYSIHCTGIWLFSGTIFRYPIRWKGFDRVCQWNFRFYISNLYLEDLYLTYFKYSFYLRILIFSPFYILLAKLFRGHSTRKLTVIILLDKARTIWMSGQLNWDGPSKSGLISHSDRVYKIRQIPFRGYYLYLFVGPFLVVCG